MPKTAPQQQALKIVGARENNLKDFSLEIPHNSFVTVTGLSGSGKSSLAFDTVYAEGQRRYIETFSPYTRQFFDKVKRPDVDVIENVRPAVAIEQRTRVTSSRSTVGSMTDINDYLKILWSNLSTPFCPSCGIELQSYDAERLSKHLKQRVSLGLLSTFLVCARFKFQAKGKKLRFEIDRLKTLGFSRFLDKESGEILLLEENESRALKDKESVVVVLDRFSAGALNLMRLKESIEQAFLLSHESCLIIPILGTVPTRRLFQILNTEAQENLRPLPFEYFEYFSNYTCKSQNLKLEKPRPGLFSYNHPLGACPDCKGFGKVLRVDPALCVPNVNLSLKEKALQCWSGPSTEWEYSRLIKFAQAQKIEIDTPWKNLPQAERDLIFNHKSKEFIGVAHWFKRKEKKAYKMHVRVFLSRYRNQFDCQTCGGSRLKPSALAYKIKGKTLPQVWSMPISSLRDWVFDLMQSHGAKKLSRHIVDVFKLILARLDYLIELGLPYLTLDRQARTLSGGETQRVNLTTAIGSELVSTQFVLDEPSVGLHMRDTERLIKAMKLLQARGNSLLVVEHDLDCINASDYILELGPQAGGKGGEITFKGEASKWKAPLISDLIPKVYAAKEKFKDCLRIKCACIRNLKGFDLNIPLNAFVSLSGVSGSGKSTLVHEIIKKNFDDKENGIENKTKSNKVEGLEKISQVLLIDQAPLSKTPRANIATFSGIWDTVRDLFAKSESAKTRALDASSFSFNVDKGRCPQCKGAGFVREDMQFLSDVYIPCEVCLGKRFQPIVLEVKLNGKNIDDFLKMSVSECKLELATSNFVREACETLEALGLSHLSLGHPLSELSGGEAQRLKLVPFIQESSKGTSLLIFDEPTTGLHFRDVKRLISLFKLLRDRGHSLLCVEHNPVFLLESDWIIDLGPEGGAAGGEVILEGTPLKFLESGASTRSYTARYLKQFTSPQSKERSIEKRAAKAGPKTLNIFGASEHNLKSLDISLPLDKVVSITGVSGSGKSTIAKDIIYAEGQRRYLDCLSPYARQFIHELKKPDIGSIENIMPTICVYQHTFQPTSLSTVGSMSEVYNFLRLLYSKVGTQYCPDHPESAITPLSPELMAEEIKNSKDSQVRILAPIVKGKKGNHRAVFERAIESEIGEVRVDGVFGRAWNMALEVERNKPHTIEYVIAKFNPKTLDLDLIKESVSQALALGSGTLIVCGDKSEQALSLERACPICRVGFFKPDPEDLSFNSKRGACPKCLGRGKNDKAEICKSCHGARINRIGRNLRLTSAKIIRKNIFEAVCLTPSELKIFLESLELDTRGSKLSQPILREIYARLDTLIKFGLDYLDLNRDCSSFSSGELQRLRLASAMGSALSGVTYIFDEPSAGLHPNDNKKILDQFGELKSRGNSVIIIEHDTETIASTEYIIDVGPGGGRDGGKIVFQGEMQEFLKSSDSATAKALRDELKIETSRSSEPLGYLQIKDGAKNNIKDLNLKIPLGAISTIAGVSGAGKSSLLHGIIYDTLMSGKASQKSWSGSEGLQIESTIPIERVLMVDQSPIGKTSRSTPASYLGIWDEIRKLFAMTVEAKSRGLTWSYFSYNSGKGRCPHCKGLGQIKLEMSFMAEASVLCESCLGSRYTEDAKSLLYAGSSISDALNLTFDEARVKFANHRKPHQALHLACELGLGYLTLGQASNTLSGGESQRIKLVSELSAKRKGHTLYILDEPTTGLHKADVFRLINVFRQLTSQGNSVLLIEHDRDMLEHSDHIIELGPGPGAQGGKVIFQGEVSKLKKAITPWGKILSRPSIHANKIPSYDATRA